MKDKDISIAATILRRIKWVEFIYPNSNLMHVFFYMWNIDPIQMQAIL
jgi:hypothetical protein